MLKVLVVEDDENKYCRVLRVLDGADASVRILSQRAGSVRDALDWLTVNHCSVLVLDLNLPMEPGGTPKEDAGVEIIRKITRKDANYHLPSRIVALTAYENLRTQFRELFEREGWVIAKYDPASLGWADTLTNAVLREALIAGRAGRYGVIMPLHGIRTIASWHKVLGDLAQERNWMCPTERWWYGRFSVFQFLLPGARNSKVKWFREQYTDAMKYYSALTGRSLIPCVVAHSFGTLILGRALLKYSDIRFDSIILCGCILPSEFPWDEILRRGQVQRVLHEVGVEDYWPVVCSYVIPGTGASGRHGFSCGSPFLVEEDHNLGHTEFFDRHRINTRWFDFFEHGDSTRPCLGGSAIPMPSGDHPAWSLVLSVVVLVGLCIVAVAAVYFQAWVVLAVFKAIYGWVNSRGIAA